MKLKVNTIYIKDCLKGLKGLPDQCVQCCVTSPPVLALKGLRYTRPIRTGVDSRRLCYGSLWSVGGGVPGAQAGRYFVAEPRGCVLGLREGWHL